MWNLSSVRAPLIITCTWCRPCLGAHEPGKAAAASFPPGSDQRELEQLDFDMRLMTVFVDFLPDKHYVGKRWDLGWPGTVFFSPGSVSGACKACSGFGCGKGRWLRPVLHWAPGVFLAGPSFPLACASLC